jgi:hypothetical protein
VGKLRRRVRSKNTGVGVMIRRGSPPSGSRRSRRLSRHNAQTHARSRTHGRARTRVRGHTHSCDNPFRSKRAEPMAGQACAPTSGAGRRADRGEVAAPSFVALLFGASAQTCKHLFVCLFWFRSMLACSALTARAGVGSQAATGRGDAAGREWAPEASRLQVRSIGPYRGCDPAVVAIAWLRHGRRDRSF